MATYNIAIVPNSWVKIVDAGDTDFLVTWDTPTNVAFAATELDEQPTVDGHQFPREKRITREDVGTGYVWAKLASTGIAPSMNLVVSKTTSIVGSTGGFDMNEGVQKVAMMAWNTTSLSWERSTGSSSGGVGVPSSVKTKLMDPASSLVLYVGEADPGSSQALGLWKIKRITFTGAGDVAAVEYAQSGAFTAIWNNRSGLSYS